MGVGFLIGRGKVVVIAKEAGAVLCWGKGQLPLQSSALSLNVT